MGCGPSKSEPQVTALTTKAVSLKTKEFIISSDSKPIKSVAANDQTNGDVNKLPPQTDYTIENLQVRISSDKVISNGDSVAGSSTGSEAEGQDGLQADLKPYVSKGDPESLQAQPVKFDPQVEADSISDTNLTKSATPTKKDSRIIEEFLKTPDSAEMASPGDFSYRIKDSQVLESFVQLQSSSPLSNCLQSFADSAVPASTGERISTVYSETITIGNEPDMIKTRGRNPIFLHLPADNQSLFNLATRTGILSFPEITATPNLYGYLAISHVWGPHATLQPQVFLAEFETGPVILNMDDTNKLAVLNALFHELAANVSQYQPAIWIDILCINQNAPNVKHAQVEIMGEVYAKAQKVIGIVSADVIELIQDGFADIIKRVRLICKGQLSEGGVKGGVLVLEKESLDDVLDTEPVGLKALSKVHQKLLGNEYFQRVWTMQELLVAKRFEYQSQNTKLDVWVLVVELAKAMHEMYSKNIIIHRTYGIQIMKFLMMTTPINHFTPFKTALLGAPGYYTSAIILHILTATIRSAYMPHDYIFAAQLLERNKIPVDYSKDIQSLLHEFHHRTFLYCSGVGPLAGYTKIMTTPEKTVCESAAMNVSPSAKSWSLDISTVPPSSLNSHSIYSHFLLSPRNCTFTSGDLFSKTNHTKHAWMSPTVAMELEPYFTLETTLLAQHIDEIQGADRRVAGVDKFMEQWVKLSGRNEFVSGERVGWSNGMCGVIVAILKAVVDMNRDDKIGEKRALETHICGRSNDGSIFSNDGPVNTGYNSQFEGKPAVCKAGLIEMHAVDTTAIISFKCTDITQVCSCAVSAARRYEITDFWIVNALLKSNEVEELEIARKQVFEQAGVKHVSVDVLLGMWKTAAPHEFSLYFTEDKKHAFLVEGDAKLHQGVEEGCLLHIAKCVFERQVRWCMLNRQGVDVTGHRWNLIHIDVWPHQQLHNLNVQSEIEIY